MKFSHLLFAAAALAGSALVLSAGPGPQFPNRPAPIKPAAASTATTTSAMPCAMCQTIAITEFSATNPSGKLAPHSTQVGTEHSCTGCIGTIRVANGSTKGDMKPICPICAKAAANCCKHAS